MPLISVLTAAYAPAAGHLADTADSVHALNLPPGWELEWVIQEDGLKASLSGHFDTLGYVRYEANMGQLGVAATRNLALSRASGDLVQVLDHDDILLPDAFLSIIPRITEGIHWAVGQADDLMPDGTRIPWDSALPYGVIPAGMVNQWARVRKGNWPVHCAGLTIRTASLRAIGGWSGVPAEDDIVMFAALSEIFDGYNEEAVTWLYRQHPHQTNRTEKWQQRSEVGRRIALQRALAIRSLGADGQTQPPAAADVGPSIKAKRHLPSSGR